MPVYDVNTTGSVVSKVNQMFDVNTTGSVVSRLGSAYDVNLWGSVVTRIFAAERLIVTPARVDSVTSGAWVKKMGEWLSFQGYNRLEIVFRSDNWQASDVVYSYSNCGIYDANMNALWVQEGSGDKIVLGYTPPWVVRTFDISGWQGSYYVGMAVASRGGGVGNWAEIRSARLYNV